MPRRKDLNTLSLFGKSDGVLLNVPKKANTKADSDDFYSIVDKQGNPIVFDNGKTALVLEDDGSGIEPKIDEDLVQTIKEFVPYYYQEECFKALLWAISKKNPEGTTSSAAVMATGCGKTSIGCMIAKKVSKKFKRNVLIIVNQEELMEQWLDRLDSMGITGLREQGTYRALDEMGSVDGESGVVVVGMEQTLRGQRLERWERDFFDLIIHDECDMSLAPKWLLIFDYFVTARHIGLTATPDRLDGKYITEKFPTIAYEMNIDRAVREGYLVRPVEKRAQHKKIDLTKIKITAGDFNKKGLDEVISNNIGAIAETSLPMLNGKPTLAFTPTVFTAEALAAAYRKLGATAEAISGKESKAERRRKFEDMRDGKLQILCNCQLVTRGVDIPCAENIVLARPTTSRALFVQMVGRGLRNYANEETGYVKKQCRIINFAWKFQKRRHSLVHPIELWDTSGLDERVINKARAMYDSIMAKNPTQELDAREVIKLAEKNIREEIERRINWKFDGAKAQVTTLDPLILDVLEVPQRPATNWMNKMAASEAQKNYLRNKFGVEVDEIKDLTMQKAGRLLDELKRRDAQGLATWKQVKTLIKCKVSPNEARLFSRTEAKAYLEINLPKQPWFGKTAPVNRASRITPVGAWDVGAE